MGPYKQNWSNNTDNGEGNSTNTNTEQYKTRQLNEHLH